MTTYIVGPIGLGAYIFMNSFLTALSYDSGITSTGRVELILNRTVKTPYLWSQKMKTIVLNVLAVVVLSGGIASLFIWEAVANRADVKFYEDSAIGRQSPY